MTNEENRLIAIHVNLMVNSIEDTLEYYEDIGFHTLQKLPIDSPQWSRVQKDDVSLMFQSASSLQSEFPQLRPSSNGVPLTLWIQTDHIADYYESIKGKTKIVKPLGITEYNGATEFVIEDINGYLLHFSNLQL